MQWTQNVDFPCQQPVVTCGYSAGPQNNWLITQLINRTVNGTRLPQVNVMIEFELFDCNTTLSCQRTFNTHIYETSSVDSAGARNVINYQQVQRISLDSSLGSPLLNRTIVVNFNTNNSSFYFAIQDEATCIYVTRLLVFYHICPKQTVNLIQHPEIIAPKLGRSTVVIAVCAMNAAPVSGLAPQGLICTAEGVWNRMPPGAGCSCVAGYFHTSNEMCKCKCIDFTVSQLICMQFSVYLLL